MKIYKYFIFLGFFLGLFILFLSFGNFQSTGFVTYEEKEIEKSASINFVIEITNAEHLDTNKNFISNIYEETKAQDDFWSEEIKDGEFVRITFEQNLTSENDITIYPRVIGGNPRIEVYESPKDDSGEPKDGTEIIAEFISLRENQYNKVLFPDFEGYQDTFDLKILGGSLEFDYILDAYSLDSCTLYLPNSDPNIETGQQFTITAEACTSGSGGGYDDPEMTARYCDTGPGCSPITIMSASGGLSTATTNPQSCGNNCKSACFNFTWTVDGSTAGDYTIDVLCDTTLPGTPDTADQDITINAPVDAPPYFTLIPANVSDTYLVANVNADFNAADAVSFGGFYLNDTSNFTIDYSTGILTNNSPLFVGNYALNVTINDSVLNINWTIFTVAVSQAIPTGTLTNNESWTVTYPTSIAIGLTESNIGDTDLVYNVTRDGIYKNSGESVLLGFGTYNYNLNTTGGYNYTLNASMNPKLLTVNKNAGACQVLFNESSGIIYPATFLVYTDCTTDFTLTRNGTIITNNTEQALVANAYNFSVQRTDTTNYSNTVNEAQFIVNPDTLSPNWFSNSTNGTDAGEWIQHSVNWTDNIALSGYIFEFDNGTGSFTNDSFVIFSGTQNWSNVTKYINETSSTMRWRFYANDTTNNWNQTSIFQYNSVSDTPPQSSNYVEFPTDSPTYSTGAAYQFNTTWTDDVGISFVWMEHNFTGTLTNYTLPNISSVWYYNYSNLAAGYYSWRMYANDTLNVWSSTSQFGYTINQNTENCQVLFNETSPKNYPSTFLVYTDCTTDFTLTRNGTTITNNTEQVLSASAYNFSVQRTDIVNYSNTVNEAQFIISQAIPTGTLTNNESWTVTYPTSVTIGLSTSNPGGGDLVYNVTKDGIYKNSGESVLLGIGGYNYDLNTSGGTNYTANASMNPKTLTVDPNAGSCSVYFNETSPITYPATFKVYTNCTSAYILYQNGTNIANASVINAGAGAYNFSVQRTDASNYSNTYNEQEFQVTKAIPTITKLLNGATNNETVSYPTGINASAFTDQGYLEIWRNETNITSQNNINETLAVNYYEYKFNVTGTQNYSDIAREYLYATINQNTENCQVLFNTSSPKAYPTTFLVYTDCNSDFTLTRNGTTITNNTEQALGSSAYNFSVQRTDTANYSNTVNEAQFIIDKGIGEIATHIDEVRGDSPVLFNSNASLNATLITGVGDIELYYNGTLINSGASPLSNITNFTEEGTWNVSSVYNGNENYTADTETFWVTVSTDSAPILNIIYPQNIFYNGDITNITYTVTDDMFLSYCWYSLNEGITNSSLDAACSNFTGLSSLEESNTWTVYANDSIAQQSIDTVTFTKDTIYPSINSLIESPTDSPTYSSGVSYQFNATTTDLNLDTVLIEFNSLNYTPTQTGNVYDFIVTDLTIGIHNYFWHANDSAGNVNTTSGTYTVNQNSENCQVLFNETSPLVYPATFLVYTNCNSDFTLTRNGTTITNNTEQALATNTYNFSVQRTDTVNYSNIYDDEFFTINITTGNVALLINATAGNQIGIYGVQTNASASTTQGTITLYRNGTDVTSDNHAWVTLAANYYNYTAVSSGNENYTSVSTTLFSTISKATSMVNLTVNNTDGNITIVQDNFIYLNTTTLTGDSGATLRMYSNNLLINQGTSSINNYTQFNSVGEFNITGIYIESENYTGSFETWYVNVTETPDITNPIVATLTEYPGDPSTYDLSNVYFFNATIIDNRNLSMVFFEFDGTNYTTTNSSDIFTYSRSNLSVGTYNYRWYANDTSTNWNNTQNGSYTINKAITSLNLVLTLSGSEIYGTETTATGSNCPSQLNCTLYRDGVAVNNLESIALAVGTYNYTYNTTGNANYTSYTNTTDLVVSKATPVLTKYLNGANSNLSITYPTTINASATTTQGALNIYRNGTNVTSENNLDISLSSNYYQYEFNVTGNENYTDLSSVYLYATVNQGTGNIKLYLNNSRGNISINPNTEIYLNATLLIGDGNIELYNNGTLIKNGSSPLFNLTNFIGLGEYNISAIYPGNINYTSDIETFFVKVKDTIITMDEFNGTTYNLNGFSNSELLNISNLTLEVVQYGKIIFGENITITSNTNLDANIEISNNLISLDSTILSNFNKSATLYLYGLNLSNPRILKDGEPCSSATCQKIEYFSANGTLIFNVTSFTDYSAEETPADSTPGGEETPSGGGGGGGIKIKGECSQNYDCQESDEVCLDNKCVKLFDIKIIDFESPIKLGEFFEFTYFVKGMANISGDVEIYFWIGDEKEKITSGQDVIYLGNFEEKTETTKIFLPSTVESGVYKFFVQVSFGEYKVQSHRTIEIEVKKGFAEIKGIREKSNRNYIYYLLGIFALVILIILIKILRKINFANKIRNWKIKRETYKSMQPTKTPIRKRFSERSNKIFRGTGFLIGKFIDSFIARIKSIKFKTKFKDNEYKFIGEKIKVSKQKHIQKKSKLLRELKKQFEKSSDKPMYENLIKYKEESAKEKIKKKEALDSKEVIEEVFRKEKMKKGEKETKVEKTDEQDNSMYEPLTKYKEKPEEKPKEEPKPMYENLIKYKDKPREKEVKEESNKPMYKSLTKSKEEPKEEVKEKPKEKENPDSKEIIEDVFRKEKMKNKFQGNSVSEEKKE